MEQKDVSLLYPVKYMAVIAHSRYRLRFVLRILQMVKTIYAVHLHEECEIQRSVDLVYDLVIDSKMLLELLKELLVHCLVHLKSYDLAPLSLLELLLDLLQQICGLLLIYGEVCISHDTVWICTHYVVVQEQLVKVLLDNLLQKNYLGNALLLRRKSHDPWKYRWNLDGRYIRHVLFLIVYECTYIQ